MLQWGNVLFCQGKRAIDKAAAAGRDVAEVAAEAEAGFAEAEAKYRESRRIKEDFYDAYVSLGNLEFERAKLALGLAVPPPRCVCNPESYLDLLGFHLCTALPVLPTAVPDASAKPLMQLFMSQDTCLMVTCVVAFFPNWPVNGQSALKK